MMWIFFLFLLKYHKANFMKILRVLAGCNAYIQPLMIIEDVQPFLKTALSNNQCN